MRHVIIEHNMLLRQRISISVKSATTADRRRLISSTSLLNNSWMDKIKGVISGQNPASPSAIPSSSKDFTLLRFAEELGKARKLGTFKQYIVGKSSEAAYTDSFLKQEAILRYLGGFDPSGERTMDIRVKSRNRDNFFLLQEMTAPQKSFSLIVVLPFLEAKRNYNLKSTQKQEAAKKCNSTIAEVENALAKFTWAKEAQKKMEKLQEEGKPIPTSMAEVQKLMGNTPMDVAQANLAKNGQISRNAFCPCGSKKRYKKCCGKD